MSLLMDPMVALVKHTDSCTQRVDDVEGAAEPTGGVLKTCYK